MKIGEISPAQMERRISRFSKLVPMQQQKPDSLPPEAMEAITAPKLYPVLSPKEDNGPWANPPIEIDEGIAMLIAECQPGEGPPLHAHHRTHEIFTVLKGAFKIAWGNEGEHEVILGLHDTIAVPMGCHRRFQNVSDEVGLLQAIILCEGGGDDFSDISYPPETGEMLASKYGPGVLDEMAKIGITFDSETDSA